MCSKDYRKAQAHQGYVKAALKKWLHEGLCVIEFERCCNSPSAAYGDEGSFIFCCLRILPCLYDQIPTSSNSHHHSPLVHQMPLWTFPASHINRLPRPITHLFLLSCLSGLQLLGRPHPLSHLFPLSLISPGDISLLFPHLNSADSLSLGICVFHLCFYLCLVPVCFSACKLFPP